MTNAPPPRERRFYLEQFSGHTLVIACDATAASDIAAVDACVADLVGEGVAVVVVGTGGRVAHWQPDDAGIVSAWRQLRRHGHMRIDLPGDHEILATGVRLATRLRAFKLVLTSPGILPAGGPVESFVTLDPDHVGGDGPVELAAEALVGGVSTVNVCRPTDLAEELFTYAGVGTCYTLGDYCRVQRVGIDDFAQVSQLIASGVEEGYLTPRDPDAIARLIVNGYGARVGDQHLAGFAALLTEPYADRAMGELCALTTISRFSGGGVGSQIVDRILADAKAAGLDGVFACTASDNAARFFRRLGFVAVPQAEVPPVKWEGYDPDRRDRVQAFVHHLVMVGAA